MMTFLRILLPLVFLLSFTGLTAAQDTAGDTTVTAPGHQTLEDILARQRGEDVPFGAEIPLPQTDNGAPAADQLGTLGGASDAELWREIRADEATAVVASNNGPAAKVLMHEGGMWWLTFREGPLLTYGGALLGGTILLLAIFFLIRGRIKIEHGRAGVTIERFKWIERFGHWLIAGSFVLLGLTGLIQLAGRKLLIPAFGHEAFSTFAIAGKWVHNNVSWAFMLGLIMVFVMWIAHNLPDRTDINWLLKGGGIFGKGHPPAKKFNAGQKLIFWSVIVLGTSISVSGLSLLFPFEITMFGPTFAKLNDLGIPQLLGFGPIEAALTPQEEMQYAQLWHAIVSFVLMAVIIAHIYIGSLGMEGAFEAMGSGEVDLEWAREHHSIWADEVESEQSKAAGKTQPAQ
jgi:formate dehydrogenase subunit gamma